MIGKKSVLFALAFLESPFLTDNTKIRRVKPGKVYVLLALALLASPFLTDTAKIRRVKPGKFYGQRESVKLVVNKVGPFNNPTETYRFYSLPFCYEHSTEEEESVAADEEDVEVNHKYHGDKQIGAQRHRQRLGESIVGDRRESSPYEISYDDSVEWRLLCTKKMLPVDIAKLKEAIHKNYFFEMFVEDLPMWGYIGEIAEEEILMEEMMEGSKTYLFTHLNFIIGHNNNQIVSAKITTDIDRKVDISDATKRLYIPFTYSVEWVEEPLLVWKKRMTTYLKSPFPSSFENHWLSIINSIVLVLLLTAFLTIILRRELKIDFSRCIVLGDDAIEEEESGWKLIHGDVFRFPENPSLFCAAVGVGNQLIVATIFHLCLTLTGLISITRRGSLLAGVVVLYCLTSFVAGYCSIRLFKQMNGKNWVQCIVLTAGLFPAPTVAIFMWVNSVALAHGSTSALPLTTILTVITLYAFIAFPLTVFGGIVAKNYPADFNAPTSTTEVAREIPTEIPWYISRPFQVTIAGFLPFSVIYNIELHYIFASMWGYKIYSLFGILLLAFILLIVVTSLVTVALLYFQLEREDHRWWWTAYINGGIAGIFIYIYSFYYYFHRSEMTGILQSSFYFGYMAVVSFGFFLMLGAAGFQFSLVFVKFIYSRVKCESKTCIMEANTILII